MDATTVIGGVTAAVASGLGLGAAMRLVPTAWHAQKDLHALTDSRESFQQPRTQEVIKRSRKRESSVVGLYQDLLRHSDGSYTRGYDLPLQATMLSPDEVADALVD